MAQEWDKLRALVGGDRVQSNEAQSHVLTAVLLHLSTGSSSVKKYSIRHVRYY